jgi:predicted ArsR family transcriptional regulator
MKILKALERAAEKELTLSEMAGSVGLTEREVCFHLDANNIRTNVTFPPIIQSVRETGKSLSEYFRDNAGASFQRMAAELGVAHSTVEQYYKIFVKAVGE